MPQLSIYVDILISGCSIFFGELEGAMGLFWIFQEIPKDTIWFILMKFG